MKIKVGKAEYEVKALGLQERCELNDLIIENMESPSFSLWVEVLRKCTNLTDDEMNAISTDNLVSIASKCIDKVNKKK